MQFFFAAIVWGCRPILLEFSQRWGIELSYGTEKEARAWLSAEPQANALRLVLCGDWVTSEAPELDAALRGVKADKTQTIAFDGSKLTSLDSVGAWLLLRSRKELIESGHRVDAFVLPPAFAPLLETLERSEQASKVRRRPPPPKPNYISAIGKGVIDSLHVGYSIFAFLGRVTVETMEAFVRPWKELPWPAFVKQIEETGLNALPIVGLLSFLIGVVIAYQGADQLARFGAQIFTINLLGASILREIGVLMTAIIIAGRSGSAFAAQIGTMQVNEEIDAMQTIGLNIVETLVIPRVLGLLVTLPLLTLYADFMGILGGAMMCYLDLGYTFPVFFRQLDAAITLNTFLVGMIKAPVFAFLIALVGCLEGLRVERNAASVGRQTTRAVVEGIFLVIVFDAAFSILFSILGI